MDAVDHLRNVLANINRNEHWDDKLRYAVEDAEAYLWENVDKAFVSLPASLNRPRSSEPGNFAKYECFHGGEKVGASVLSSDWNGAGVFRHLEVYGFTGDLKGASLNGWSGDGSLPDDMIVRTASGDEYVFKKIVTYKDDKIVRRCSVLGCGLEQKETLSGWVCDNGHGGADSVDD